MPGSCLRTHFLRGVSVSGTHTQHMTANNTRHHSQSVAVTPAICAIRYAAAGKNIMSDVASPVW